MNDQERIIAEKDEIIAKKDKEIAELKEKINNLQNQLDAIVKLMNGKKNESLSKLFPEKQGEQICFEGFEPDAVNETSGEVVVKEHTAKKRKPKITNAEKFRGLEREIISCPVKDKICKNCGREMKVITKDHKIREELAYIPAKLFVKEYHAEVCKCEKCCAVHSKANDEGKPERYTTANGFVTAAAPVSFITGSFVSAELEAGIAYNKYVLAVPFYRQEQHFRSMGVPINRQSMNNWTAAVREKYVVPVLKEAEKVLLASRLTHSDETTCRINKNALVKPYVWLFANSEYDEHTVLRYKNFKGARTQAAVNSFLKDYHGYVETDGFSGYNDLPEGIIRCTCWSHMRRRWVDALPKTECSDPNSVSAKALLMIPEIYAEDNKLSELSIDERTEKRQKVIKPLTDRFYSWLETLTAETDSLKKAIHYALNQKTSLLRFLENGIIPLDNNRAERAIRPFAIGRKNWLACENDESADVCMDMYSIVRTAMANGLNVFDYLVRLFSAAPGELVMPW